MEDDTPDDVRDGTAGDADPTDERAAPDAPRAEEVVAEALERLARGATELAETVVGLGVLGVNRLQALRRDLQAQAERARTAADDEMEA